MRTAIVLCGGDFAGQVVPTVHGDVYVVAADSGLHLAGQLGRPVDLVVGDFDSVDPAELERAEAAGADIDRRPAAKDATDLELALIAAVSSGAEHITVVGGAGGRLDHLLANFGALASPAFAAVPIDAYVGAARVHVTHGRTVTITGAVGDLVTLLPMWGAACGIVTTGLEYPLRNEDLPCGTSRGVSNVLLETHATVALASGTLLVVQP